MKLKLIKTGHPRADRKRMREGTIIQDDTSSEEMMDEEELARMIRKSKKLKRKVVASEELNLKEKTGENVTTDVISRAMSQTTMNKGESKVPDKHEVRNEPTVEECEQAFAEEFKDSESEDEDSESSHSDYENEVIAEGKKRNLIDSEEDGEEDSKSNIGVRRNHVSKRTLRFLSPYVKPPMNIPTDITEMQRKEATYFQRKMRAFRNLKNHLLTADLKEIEEEAERKNWGKLPKFMYKARPRFEITHIEVMYDMWPNPFEETEKVWLNRHFKEFATAWEVPDDEVLKSDLLTPYMKYIRCYPDPILLQLKDIKPPEDKPPRYAMGLPITGKNIIIDAKAVLTCYGMHRLKEWEVHSYVDYDMIDFQILLEELTEASRLMIEKIKTKKIEDKFCKQE